MQAITIEKMVYLDKSKQTPISASTLEAALAIEPVTVLVDNSGIEFMAYAGGIIDSAECGQNATFPMVAVGWGIENGKQYYILKNTWGENWGEKGYARIAATESGWGVCGVQSMG